MLMILVIHIVMESASDPCHAHYDWNAGDAVGGCLWHRFCLRDGERTGDSDHKTWSGHQCPQTWPGEKGQSYLVQQSGVSLDRRNARIYIYIYRERERESGHAAFYRFASTDAKHYVKRLVN